jgi:hypothetical protein
LAHIHDLAIGLDRLVPAALHGQGNCLLRQLPPPGAGRLFLFVGCRELVYFHVSVTSFLGVTQESSVLSTATYGKNRAAVHGVIPIAAQRVPTADIERD